MVEVDDLEVKILDRPDITQYSEPSRFIRDMVTYRKSCERGFSVSGQTHTLDRLSPALVSLVARGKRKLSFDRIDDFSKLLKLTAQERAQLRNWARRQSKRDSRSDEPVSSQVPSSEVQDLPLSFLSDWIHAYVKDLFEIPAVQTQPSLIFRYLGFVATEKRITRALQFLLHQGYLRKKMNGSIVPEFNLAIADPKVSSRQIRRFHQGALSVARHALRHYGPNERIANTLVIPLNKDGYDELSSLIDDFAEKLKDFASKKQRPATRLYQLIINLSPVGDKTP